jgi:hypothetical protein
MRNVSVLDFARPEYPAAWQDADAEEAAGTAKEPLATVAMFAQKPSSNCH